MPRWFEDNSLATGRMPLARPSRVAVAPPDSSERSVSAALSEGRFDAEGIAA